MPAINFKTELAAAVELGTKRQTIRQVWKRPIKVGDALYLYTGLRTKEARKLKTTACASVTPVRIEHNRIFLDGRRINAAEGYALAGDDGFWGLGQLITFFEDHYGLPFNGVIIKW